MLLPNLIVNRLTGSLIEGLTGELTEGWAGGKGTRKKLYKQVLFLFSNGNSTNKDKNHANITRCKFK